MAVPKTNVRKVCRLGCLCLLAVMAVLALTGRATALPEIAVAVVMEKGKSTDKNKQAKLETSLTKRLCDALNRYQRASFKAEAIEGQTYDQCRKDNKCREKYREFKYFVLITVEEKNSRLESTIKVLSDDDKELHSFTAEDAIESPNPLVPEIMEKLIVRLTQNIRVAMSDFRMLGKSEKDYSQLGRILPNMLTEGLTLSAGIVVIDVLDDVDRKQMTEATNPSQTVHNRATIPNIEKILFANYRIYGEYGEMAGGLRVDVWCVNRETREIIVKRGRTIFPITLSAVEKEMAKIAADVRAAVVANYAMRGHRTRYLAFSGYPPLKDTKENRATLLEIIRTTSRKLQSLELKDMRVKESLDMVERHISNKTHPWTMSEELEVDQIITFNLDRTDRDRMVLNVTRFDAQDPKESFDLLSQHASPEKVGEALDKIIEAMQKEHWIEVDGDLAVMQQKIQQIEYVGLYKPFGVQARFGVSIRNDPTLFLDSVGGLALDFGLIWNPSRSMRWEIEPLRVRLDFMGSRAGGDKTVTGGDVLVGLNYRFRPHYEQSFYVGASLGFLGVVRSVPNDYSYDGVPGAGLAAGLEYTMPSSRKVNYRLEYTRGFSAIPPRTIGAEGFPGGTPGGLYLLIGTEF